MKKFLTFIFCILFILSFIFNITSCTFESEEDYRDINECDSVEVSYGDLTYIFTGICSNCHIEPYSPRPEILMNTYDNVKSSINTGKVWPAINHVEGVPAMPYGLPKLSDCDLAKIKAWIDAGMPENK